MSNTELYEAILKVQQDAPFIDKSAANPFFKSKYADLPAIWKAIKELMGVNGILVTHSMTACVDGEFIHTKIIHAKSGQEMESVSKITLSKVTAQEYGSYITYMRRYALSAMLGLVTDEDDDGNKATEAAKTKTQPKAPNPPKAEKSWEQVRANEIAVAIDKHKDLQALEKMWEMNAKDLDKINLASEKAYGALLAKYHAKRVELENKEMDGSHE